MLDADLADLYGVNVKALNQAVRRNIERFPDDFMFQLTQEEWKNLRSTSVTSSSHGGRRYLPLAFTEEGVGMLSSVLRSTRAVQVNIEIVRTFVALRRFALTHDELRQRLDAFEAKTDKRFKNVVAAIRALMTSEAPNRTRGFARKG